NETEVKTLLLNGRIAYQLISLVPGVSNQTGQDEGKTGVAGSAKYSVNGGRVEYNIFEVDGTDVLNNGINAARGSNTFIVNPSVDAIGEMKVLTSNYGAMYGKTASGIVQITTKSGTSGFQVMATSLSGTKCSMPATTLTRRNRLHSTAGMTSDLLWGDPFMFPGTITLANRKPFSFSLRSFGTRKLRSPTTRQFRQTQSGPEISATFVRRIRHLQLRR